MSTGAGNVARSMTPTTGTPRLDGENSIHGVFHIACPICRTLLEPHSADALTCPNDGATYPRTGGIWRLLPPDRAEHFAQFIVEYETIRRAEGRGANDPGFYRALPFQDRSGCFVNDWRIRATSFQALIDRIVQPLEAARCRPLVILDLGAGNGWLSYRLAQRDHHVAAVDLLTNPFDGLGAYTHYDQEFTPIQAEFDHLPFARDQADLVIFNGALHYSPDYHATLTDALRVLREDGELVIMDSPVYRDAESGRQMVREREAQFTERFGFPSNAIPSENYLTNRRLNELGDALGIRWQSIEPFYGVRWALRPWQAKLTGRREPARFLLVTGARRTQPVPPSSMIKRKLWRRLLRLRFRLLQRHRHNRLVLEEAAGRPLLVLPEVFNPALFRTSEILARALSDAAAPPGATVLDMGTGSGIGAIVAASWASRIIAVDINPEAVRCTRINALLNRVEEVVEVRQGDLFAAVEGERFDIVLFNPPYFRGTPRDALDHAWRSIDVAERFAGGLAEHLTRDGAALIVLSSDGDSRAFLDQCRCHGFDIDVLSETDLLNETVTVYQVKVRRG